MPDFEGYSSFKKEDVLRVFLKIPKNIRLDYCIEKELKPYWWFWDDWRQTWSIRKKI